MAFGSSWFWILILMLLGVAVAGWAGAYGLTWLSIRLALRFQIVARPNERTSHEGSIPRIGGIGIAVPSLVALAVAGGWVWMGGASVGGGEAGKSAAVGIHWQFVWAALIGGTGAFLLGLWDDVRSIPALTKLVGQVIVAAIPPVAGIRLYAIGLPGLPVWEIPPFVGEAAAFLWILFWMNAYNFMDGINGIAGRFGEILALAMVVMVAGLFAAEAYFLAFLAGTCFGFLRWNLPAAQTFMGDCGSQFLGFLIAVWTLYLPIRMQVPSAFAAMVVLTLPFSWDVGYTLLRRAARGENLLKAHRSHLYQRLASTGLSHGETLAACERTFYICALSAVALARLRATGGQTALLWGCMAVSILTIVGYTGYIWHRERRMRSPGRGSDRC